ncbi:transcriptional regulator [Duganella sp. FT92W]|uniref:Transcriptional regulator n=1 Tax=Pseudoduganella rivuli TaxID=2666085 RepID=A0A7X2LTD1_9BURK|nr:DJ-1/PfpI family protein [Pseudoduganella rivuli]MRV72828.1 transcriptional regulator [Pseudoduganella rivuli]
MPRTAILAIFTAALLGAAPLYAAGQQQAAAVATAVTPAVTPAAGAIERYQPRFGRSRPLVAVVGDNHGTELTDFVIPYSVLRRAGVADVLAVATQDGPLQMLPGLRIAPDVAIAQFDERYPDGADYVIVPAVVHDAGPALPQWVAAQAAKGATIVSICDGALVLANSGIMKGKSGTGHWATDSLRKDRYPETRWLDNARYVADGKVVSSAGISASLPVSLALVEAIAGTERATALAEEMAAGDWSQAHDSAPFRPRFGVNLAAHATRFTNPVLHHKDMLAVQVADGVDELALALTVDAWSRTGRSKAYAASGADVPVRTLNGLSVLPEAPGLVPDRMLAAQAAPPGKVFGHLLDDIAQAYGKLTAHRVALDFEYPGYP